MADSPNKTLTPCSRFEDELEAYWEGEARPFIASHARDCGLCAVLLADLQSIRQEARNLPQEEPSPAVWANLQLKLASERALRVAACGQFAMEVEAYMEGEARPFISSHAQDCASCGALLTDLQAIQRAARDLPQEEPSGAVWLTLRAKLIAEGAFPAPACSQFNDELGAYMEGEARPFIVSHAEHCRSCGALLADLQFIRQSARELPQVEPSRAVWLRVRQNLIEDGTFRQSAGGWRQILSWRWVPQLVPMGALAGLVVLASVLTLPSSSIQRWEGDNQAVSFPGAKVASVLTRDDDGALARVVSDLESNFKANESSMAPDLKATYEKSLVSLDGSIKECLESLRHEPRNTLAHDYLLTAYTRKAEVLSSALEFDGR